MKDDNNIERKVEEFGSWKDFFKNSHTYYHTFYMISKYLGGFYLMSNTDLYTTQDFIGTYTALSGIGEFFMLGGLLAISKKGGETEKEFKELIGKLPLEISFGKAIYKLIKNKGNF